MARCRLVLLTATLGSCLGTWPGAAGRGSTSLPAVPGEYLPPGTASERASSAGPRPTRWSDEDRETVASQLARAFNSSLSGDPEFRRDALEKIAQGQCIVRLAGDDVDILYDESAILTIEARWLKKNQLMVIEEDGTDLDDDDNPWGSALVSLPLLPRAPQPWA
ncbi:MAG: hypothetical protein HY551_00360, partial [Elusimicrobia bacterium]|nr:hypothetical protein [Elusimicrobiota bacterium]